MKKIVDVSAGVIRRADGAFLLGQRAPGTFYPGYWEFPGGKVEAGESPVDALIRELDEELGINVTDVWPWLVREHAYEHALVRLHFFEVSAWEGKVNDHVHSALSWECAGRVSVSPMLPANGPIMKALCLPRFIGITHAVHIGIDAQLSQLEHALEDGLRFVLIREPGMPATDLRAFATEVIRRARRAGAMVLVNGAPVLAESLEADGVHLTSRELAACSSRPPFAWVGASCHDRAELEHAALIGVDYALLGPVAETATHPGVTGLGWTRFSELVGSLPMPVLALGGLSKADLLTAQRAGAHGIAAIRSAWQAPGVSPR